jgi:hypothetical protein
MYIAVPIGVVGLKARAADVYLARRTATGRRGPTAVPAHAAAFSTRRDALAWMTAERLNLHAAVGAAASRDHIGQANTRSAWL